MRNQKHPNRNIAGLLRAPTATAIRCYAAASTIVRAALSGETTVIYITPGMAFLPYRAVGKKMTDPFEAQDSSF